MKNISFFLFKNFQFLEVKFSIYLNKCVFVMSKTESCGIKKSAKETNTADSVLVSLFLYNKESCDAAYALSANASLNRNKQQSVIQKHKAI